jgi:hypothetical protein
LLLFGKQQDFSFGGCKGLSLTYLLADYNKIGKVLLHPAKRLTAGQQSASPGLILIKDGPRSPPA